MKPEPWLVYDGVEIANAQRTFQYLRSGLGPAGWSIFDCDCEAYSDGPYVSPSADPAPWYVAANAASSEFLGMLVNNGELSVPYSRSQTARGGGGSVLGVPTLLGRTITVNGLLVAKTPRGMAYGKRWLQEALRGGCTTCGTADLCILPYCSDDDADPDAAFRTLYRVGLIDGPLFAPAEDGIAQCYVLDTTFSFHSELTHLHGDETTCVDEQALLTSASQCCSVTVPEWPSETAFRVEVSAGSPDPVTGLRVRLVPDTDGICSGPIDSATFVLRADSYETTDGATWQDESANNLDFTINGAPRHLPKSDYGQYAYLPAVGTSGNNISTPASTMFTPASGLLITEAMIQPDDWTPAAVDRAIISTWSTAGTKSWRLALAPTGHLKWQYTSDGTTVQTLQTENPLPYNPGSPLWVRCAFAYNNSSSATAYFYYKLSEDSPWLPLGSVGGTVFTIFAAAVTTNVGRSAPLDLEEFEGKIWYAKVMANISATADPEEDHSVIGAFDARLMTEPFASYGDEVGRTWTFSAHTSGYPNVIVDHSCWLMNRAGDYFSRADNPLLDVLAADSFTVITINRFWQITTAPQVQVAKRASGGTTQGWSIVTDQSGIATGGGSDGVGNGNDLRGGALVGRLDAVSTVRSVTADRVYTRRDQATTTGTSDSTTGSWANAEEVRIGRYSGAGTTYAGGQIFAVAMWKRALTVAEITQAVTYLLGGDPIGTDGAACSEFTVASLPAGTRLEIDGARQTIEVVQESSGQLVGSLDVLDLPEDRAFSWPVASHCATACLCVSAYGGQVNPNTKVSISKVERDF